MCTRLTLVPLAGVLLLFAGCVPESKEPLGSLAAAQQDTRLNGTWTYTQPDGKVQYLHIGEESEIPANSRQDFPEDGLMRFWLITLDPKAGEVSKPFGLRFFRTHIDDTDYANCIVAPDPDLDTGESSRYWFFKYRVRGSELEVWSMDFEASGRAIDSGKLPGTTEHNSDGQLTKANLTASTGELVAYLEARGDKVLFPEEQGAVYRRLSNPGVAAE